jgi:hypothetical protein
MYRAGIILTMVIFLYSCAGPSGSVRFSGSAGPYTRIAVLPFQQVSPEDTIGNLVPRHIAGFRDETVESPETVVETVFLSRLAENKKIEIVPVEETRGAYREITTDTLTAQEADLIRKLGQKLKAEAIVVGYVFRYQERKGTPYAVDKPASVAFELQLLDTREGTRSWKATFDKTQRSLMENLLQFRFFVKEKGRWLTARELTDEGVDQILQGFPGPR